jgi:hypothetical protein
MMRRHGIHMPRHLRSLLARSYILYLAHLVIAHIIIFIAADCHIASIIQLSVYHNFIAFTI